MFGLTLSPKHPGISLRAVLIILAVFMLLEGLASVSGLAGAAVIYAVESRINQQTNAMAITDYEAVGAVVGPISAAVLMVQILLIYLSQRFQWSLLCGRRSLAVSAAGSVIILLLIILASVFARTMLPALYVARTRGISGQSLRIPDNDLMNNSIPSSKPKHIDCSRCHGRPIDAFDNLPKHILDFPSFSWPYHPAKRNSWNHPCVVDHASRVSDIPHWARYIGWLHVWQDISIYR